MTIESDLISRKNKCKSSAKKYRAAELKRPYKSIKKPITILVEPE